MSALSAWVAEARGILDLILDMDDIEVSAVCDCYEDRAQKGVEIVQKKRDYAPSPTPTIKNCSSGTT